MNQGARSYPKNLPADELICLPFLDTDNTADLAAAESELRARGYSPRTIVILRSIARIGLWYQVFAWDWASLDGFDVLLGYVPCGLVAATLAALLGQYLTGGILLAISLLLLAVAIVGTRLRRRNLERHGG